MYSAAQAALGEQTYRAKCGDCHGRALEGAIGPPLVGDSFLANWSARPLATLVDKIQKTMPFSCPGSLSRPPIDRPPGLYSSGRQVPRRTAELDDDVLAQIVFPTASTPPAPAAAAGASLPPPEGNLAELMRAIAFPNANIIFNLQLKDPGAAAKKPLASSPFDYVEWGSTVYPGWLAVDQAAVAHHRNRGVAADAGTPLPERQDRPRRSRRLEGVCRGDG